MMEYGMSASTDGELQAIARMIELLVIDGYSVEIHTQPSADPMLGEYVVTVSSGDSVEACCEMPRLFDAAKSVYGVIPTIDDFGTVIMRTLGDL